MSETDQLVDEQLQGTLDRLILAGLGVTFLAVALLALLGAG